MDAVEYWVDLQLGRFDSALIPPITMGLTVPKQETVYVTFVYWLGHLTFYQVRRVRLPHVTPNYGLFV